MMTARLAACVLIAPLLIACGAQFRSEPQAPPDEGTVERAALRDIYDVWVEIPGVLLPGRALPVTLAADLEITFTTGTAPEGTSTARVRLLGQLLDGAAIPLPVPAAWDVGFVREEDRLDFDPIEPFGVAGIEDSLLLELALGDGGRRLEGTAALILLGRSGTARGVRQRNYLAATTDYAFGGSVVRLRARYDERFTLFQGVEDAWVDPFVRVESGSVYLINRLELVFSEEDDNRHIEWLSPDEEYRTIFSFSLGDGANPQDVVLDARGRMWVSRYEPPYSDLLIVNPRTGERLGRIDLLPWVTAAGFVPRPDQMIRSGDEIYVTLQNTNLAFSAYGPARMLVIDTDTDTVAATIDLEGINPFQGLERDPASGLLYLAMAGIFPGQQPEQLTGGVEVVDPATRTSLGILVDDDDLGGHPSDVAIASSEKGYVLISRRSGQEFLTDVVAFDPRDGAILGTVFSGGATGRYQVVDLEADSEGWLLLALRDPFDSGILILDTTTDRPLPGGRFRTSLFTVSLATVRIGS